MPYISPYIYHVSHKFYRVLPPPTQRLRLLLSTTHPLPTPAAPMARSRYQLMMTKLFGIILMFKEEEVNDEEGSKDEKVTTVRE